MKSKEVKYLCLGSLTFTNYHTRSFTKQNYKKHKCNKCQFSLILIGSKLKTL